MASANLTKIRAELDAFVEWMKSRFPIGLMVDYPGLQHGLCRSAISYVDGSTQLIMYMITAMEDPTDDRCLKVRIAKQNLLFSLTFAIRYFDLYRTNETAVLCPVMLNYIIGLFENCPIESYINSWTPESNGV